MTNVRLEGEHDYCLGLPFHTSIASKRCHEDKSELFKRSLKPGFRGFKTLILLDKGSSERYIRPMRRLCRSRYCSYRPEVMGLSKIVVECPEASYLHL